MASFRKLLSRSFLFRRNHWWYCWILLLLSSSKLVKASSANQFDYDALFSLKGQVTGEVLTIWNDSTHYCSWPGVICSSQDPGRVSALNLQNMKLQGTLSPYIGNLTFLRAINLTANNFHGAIPQEISRLVHLQELSLGNNLFTGKLPSNLTYCAELEVIDLVSNKMSGAIYPELSSLSKLKLLRLTDNNFTGNIPSSFGNLSSLTKLSMQGNILDGNIPNTLCLIPKLSFFQVSANYLTGKVSSCFYNNSAMEIFSVADNGLEGSLPSNFGLTLPNIRELYMGANHFQGTIPASVTNASSLETIDLFRNNFTGSVPENLGVLSNLTEICFNRNQLGTDGGRDLDFITSLTNCSNLKELEFERNSLKGPLPQSLSNLSMQLTRLIAWENQIYGSIPLGIQNLINMQSIDLHENSLTGSIPVTIGRLRSLIQLNLQGNQLSGEIPNSLGNLTQLTDLNLGGNSLRGTIPHTLENCQNLLLLNLSHNNLFGTIPIQVMLPSLTKGLFLQNNSFSGSLPLELGNLTKITTLDVSKNKLSGQIPESLGDCLTLVALYLDGNSFQGKIPLSMNGLEGLVEVDISQNQLSGEIPEYLQWFPLSKLNLSFNRFQGKVPSKGVFANATSVYVYGNGDLCGGAVQLQLPPCRVSATKTSFFTKATIFMIIAAVFLVAGIFVSFLVCCMRKVSKTKPHVTSMFSHPSKVTYAELVKATNGFSTENLIGSGSFGSVFKGILNEMNKIVAVKVLHLYREGALKSFVSECVALKNLRHRNLCKLITVCSGLDYQGNDFRALVYEYMPNGSLEDWLHPREDQMKKLNFIQRLNIAIDIASALEYLHHHFQPAIVHCDLKPSNVLLDKDLVAHVSDFGIAKFLSSTASNTLDSEVSTHVIKGSIGYVAPEYVMASHVSTLGDVYSYGILLLEMFTRKRPTDDVFVDGLCLHNYAEIALSGNVVDIVDADVFSEWLQECLISVIRVGVLCSNERAVDRVSMKEVIKELQRIRDLHICQ